MGRLSTAARKALPGSAFLGPHKSFPAEDADHAEKAIQLAPRAEKSGSISASQEKSIVSRAKARLKGFKGHGIKYQGHTAHKD